jgi:hypothetical protein
MILVDAYGMLAVPPYSRARVKVVCRIMDD